MAVLLTVPHGYCESRLYRDCDSNSTSVAYALKRYLPNAKLIENDTLREVVDANRLRSYTSNIFFMVTLRALDWNKYKYVIDCHSFPGNANKDECYILAYQNTRVNSQIITKLRGKGIRCNIYQAAPDNLVIWLAQKNNVNHILLEVNEYLNDDKIQEIAKIVAIEISIELGQSIDEQSGAKLFFY